MKNIKAQLRIMNAEEIAISFTGKQYNACTKQDKERVAIAMEWIANDYRGDGLLGCLIELFACSENSPKKRVSAQGRIDSRIRFRNGNGNIDYIPVEVKINGGRIENMSGSYTVYCLAVTQKHKGSKKTNGMDWEERRLIKPVVIPTKLFLSYLEEIGATKSTNGTHPQTAIQCSSKKLYEALLAWPILYDRTKTYCADDFEDLSL